MSSLALAALAVALVPPFAGEFDEIMIVGGTPPDMPHVVVAQLYATGDVAPGAILDHVTDADICTVGLEFLEHPLGTDVAPRPELLPLFPELRYDTFVTINRPDRLDDSTYVGGDFLLTPFSLQGSWSALPMHEQHEAVVGWHPTEPGRAGVMIAQLTFEIPENNGLQGVAGVVTLHTQYGKPGGSPVRFQIGLHDYQCAADLNGDGEIGPDDLSILLASWTAQAEEVESQVPLADISGDGVVDAADLSMLLDAWGRCYYRCPAS